MRASYECMPGRHNVHSLELNVVEPGRLRLTNANAAEEEEDGDDETAEALELAEAKLKS